MKRMPFAAYNLGRPGDRPARQMRREIKAILSHRDNKGRRVKVIAVFEAIGWRLPRVWAFLRGYRLIRDTSSDSRANLAVFVLRRLDVGKSQWVDHKKTWPRILHPGTHPARSTLLLPVEDWTLIVSHAPQGIQGHFPEKTKDELFAARIEWLDVIGARMVFAPEPVLLLSDPNGLDEALLHRLPEHAAKGGTNVECAHVVGAVLTQAQKVSSVGGVPMRSDHKGALIGKARR